MSISRLFKKSSLGRRTAHLAIVVFPDEGSVFQAYRLLHYHGISPEHLAIVGQGYSTPERVGLMNPFRIVTRKAMTCALIATIVGSCLSVVIALIWKLQQDVMLIIATSMAVSSLVGLVLGAIFGMLGEGTTASIYRHHLRQGRYLLMMEGSENLVRWGQEVLSYYSATSPY